MQCANLTDFTRGWIVGNFDPSLIKTNDVEVAVQHFKAGDSEPRHCHMIAIEITVIVSGAAEMNGVVYEAGSVITIPPNTYTNFKALIDTTTTVVKYPGAPNDKYMESEQC
jgi:anti-sigma factor ChrR (cupin superfamily)